MGNSRGALAYCLFPLSLPLPVSFPHIQPPTGDRRRLVFSERRELALSVVFCLLPSSSPPPSSSPRAAGKPTAKHCSHETSLDSSCGLGLPCPALPCVHLGHFFVLERLLGLPIQECGRGLPPSSSPLLAPGIVLWGPCRAAFWARALGHCHEWPPVQGQVVRELTVCRNSASRMPAELAYLLSQALPFMTGCPKFPADQGFRQMPETCSQGHTLPIGNLAKPSLSKLASQRGRIQALSLRKLNEQRALRRP